MSAYAYRPSVVLPEDWQTKICLQCQAEFRTKARMRKRCDACQSARTAKRQAAALARHGARRKGARG